MNTFDRNQVMDNQTLQLFRQQIDTEQRLIVISLSETRRKINAHPFSSINVQQGSEVRYIPTKVRFRCCL